MLNQLNMNILVIEIGGSPKLKSDRATNSFPSNSSVSPDDCRADDERRSRVPRDWASLFFFLAAISMATHGPGGHDRRSRAHNLAADGWGSLIGKP